MNNKSPVNKKGQKLLPEQTRGTKLRDTKEEELDDYKNKWMMNNRIIDLYIENIKQDQEMRSKYAEKLIEILTAELIGLIIIFVCKGIGWLNYSDATLNIFVTGGIAEVFILVRVIVKYLFKDNLTETFKIIIANNNKKHTDNKKFNKHKTSDKP